jgi:glycosyltransferase involved in cell wall biosynthesis
MDVFVLPSKAEGLSNVILEAMACGLPVVAANVGGNPELVTHETTGLLVPPSHPRHLADALECYVSSPAMAHQHGAAGRARIEREFTIPSMVEGYLDLYDRLLK